MKYQKKFIVLSGMIMIFVIFICGCANTPGIPTVPGSNPNPNVNPENSEVSYIEVSSSVSTMQTGETMQFVVKGYNSDDEWVILDKSKIILWKWTVTGVACPACISASLSPTSNSLTTTFSSGAAATFHIAAYYKENEESEIKSSYKTVQVTSKVKTIYDINSK
jgi:hypothetical protein